MCRDNYLRLRAAIGAGRPVPRDVADWLLGGFDEFEQGQRLERALGLQAGSGEAWRHPIRQMRRAEMERLYLHAADALHGRTSKSASIIADVLARMDAKTIDQLPEGAKFGVINLSLGFGLANVPRSRTPILQILKGETQAQRDGLV